MILERKFGDNTYGETKYWRLNHSNTSQNIQDQLTCMAFANASPKRENSDKDPFRNLKIKNYIISYKFKNGISL